jgi:putative colanic acid biosynthesis acetyltransferase WcaF
VWKPGLHVKYPWRLTVGDHTWIGEDCWIDSLADITIGSNVCVSQGAYLCTGNHDWSDPYFGLRVSPIVIGDGAWVGAKAVVCPGVNIEKLAILAAGSVATKSIPSAEIHVGNPAIYSRNRRIRDSSV